MQSKKHSIFAPTKCDAKMHFCTASLFFAKQKTQHFCTASHFPKENVQQTKMLESGQHKKHQTQHFSIKNIIYSNKQNSKFVTYINLKIKRSLFLV